MPQEIQISYTSALILTAVDSGLPFGFQIMDATGLPSGTVYPALRRLEKAEIIQSAWEPEKEAFAAARPARRLYKLTKHGKQTLKTVSERYRLPRIEAPAAKAMKG